MKNNQTQQNPNIITFIIISMVSMASVSSVLITPAFSIIKSTYNLTESKLDLLMSVFLFGYIIGQLIYGPVANRYGRIRALRTGLIINIVGVIIGIAAALQDYYSLLLLSRLISALGGSAGLVISFVLLNEFLPQNKAKNAIAYIPVSFAIGISLAVFIGGMVTEYLSWKFCYVILLIHGLVFYYLSFLLQETLENSNKKAINIKTIIKQFNLGFKNYNLVIFSLIIGFSTVYAYTYAVNAPLIADKIFKISSGAYGTWNLLNTIGMITGGITTAYLMKIYSSNCLIKSAYFSAFLILIILYFIYNINLSTNPLWFFIGTSMLYLITGVIYANASFLASNAISDRASASAVMSFINIASAELVISGKGLLNYNELTVFLLMIGGFGLLTTLLFLYVQKMN